MIDELITFETAKLAKEKGFNIIPSQMYGNQKVPQLEEYNETKDRLYRDYYYAPTQSLLQRWLREVHKINVEVNHLPNIEKYKCMFMPMNLKKPKEHSNVNEAYSERSKYLGKIYYEVYEEALEYGLQEALKLIK